MDKTNMEKSRGDSKKRRNAEIKNPIKKLYIV
jgi:hypothetical protein